MEFAIFVKVEDALRFTMHKRSSHCEARTEASSYFYKLDSVMKIIHFSDMHVWSLRPVWTDLCYPKRWLGGINLWLRRRSKFPPLLAQSVIQEILLQDADLLVFTGDITTQSHPVEFEIGAELFAPLHKKWGNRFLVIPGNHDRYTPKSVARGDYEHHFPYGALPHEKVRTWSIDDNWSAIGFDASVPFKLRSNGLFTDQLATTLNASLEAMSATGKNILLVGHFPYAVPNPVQDTWDHTLIGKEKLEMLVATHKPILYLHGHKHVRWVLQPATTPNTLCIDSGSAGMLSDQTTKQAGFVTIELAEDGTLEQISTAVASDSVASMFHYTDVDIGKRPTGKVDRPLSAK